MIEWVFFDVGNVLFNDDPQNFAAFQWYYEAIRAVRPAYTFAEMLADRAELARTGVTWILHKLAHRWLPEERIAALYDELRGRLVARYDEYHLPNEGIEETLDELGRRYHLGIIANQPAECRHSLARRGLLDRFKVVAISDELNLHKPDVRLLQWALTQASVDPARAVMIGDRRDNDVAPAKALGMRTIWLSWPGHGQKNWRATDPQARAWLDSCDGVPAFHALCESGNEPDCTIARLAECAAAVDELCRSFTPAAQP